MGHTTIAAYRPTKIHPRPQVAVEASAPDHRPSWLLLIVVTAAVAGLTWGIMQQRMPQIDPRQVIAHNLTAAKLAIDASRYIDPPEHSAVHYFNSVLTLDPDNQEALAGLSLLAAHFIEEAKTAILYGRFAEAALAIESVRRVQPTNRRLKLLESELRKAVEAHVAALKEEMSSRLTSTDRKATGSAAPANAAALIHSTRPSRTIEKAGTGAPLTVEPPLAPTHAISEERQESAAVADPAGMAVSQAASAHAAYADLEHAYETAAQQIALYARNRTSETPAFDAVPSAPPLTQPLASAGRGPELPSPAVPKAIRLVEPQYPQAAQVRGIEGWVDLTLTVAASGDVIGARVEEREGSRSFERAALIAVRQWKYEPFAAPDSDAPPQEILVRVGFRLE